MKVTHTPAVYPEPKPTTPETFTLELSREEAELVCAVFCFVGGSVGGPIASRLLGSMNRPLAGFDHHRAFRIWDGNNPNRRPTGIYVDLW